jgi:hypothetical protein
MTTPKQEAIRAALRESPGLSNRQIAKRIGGAHHVTVGNVRKALEASGELPRADTVTGGDGKTYSKAKTSKPKAKAHKPASLDEQVTRAMASLLRQSRKGGGVDELADAFRRYYAAHLVPPRVTPGVDITAVLAAELKRRKAVAEISNHHGTSPLAEVVTEVADPPTATVNQPEQSVSEAAPQKSSPSLKVRDVARDITPDADNDDYGDLPTEERIALHEDQAALERHQGETASEPKTASLPEGQWMRGDVVYINQFTQCGRVCLPDFGDLGFTDRTPRAAGLKLQQGLEVECRFVLRHGHPWVVEFAKAQVGGLTRRVTTSHLGRV